MTEERIRELESIGLVWNQQQDHDVPHGSSPVESCRYDELCFWGANRLSVRS